MADGEKSLKNIAPPTESDYLFTANNLDIELGQDGDSLVRLKKLTAPFLYHQTSQFIRGVEMAAESLNDPLDRLISETGENKPSSIFASGTLVGVAMVDDVHEGLLPLQQILRGNALQVPVPPNEEDARSVQADALVEYGERGIAQMGSEAEAILQDIADQIVPISDLRHQRMFLRGCGFITLRAFEIHTAIYEAHRLDTIIANGENELRTVADDKNYDWDAAWKKFNSSGGNS